MTKRRSDADDLTNVLRQKYKEDPVRRQQVARNTFQMLMNSQKRSAAVANNLKSQNHLAVPDALPLCYKCTANMACDKCMFCEKALCSDCSQQCIQCQCLYCSTCSEIDYSLATDRVLCLSCKREKSI